MNTKTHRSLAEMIYVDLDLYFQEKIDLTSFKKGSVFPDLNIIYRFKEHTYKGSFHIIRKLINDISNNSLSPNKLGFKLGVISHFMTDYCCAYHSNPLYMKKNLKHRKYEIKAEKTLGYLMEKPKGPKLSSLDNLQTELEVYLNNNHSMDVIPNYKRDLVHALSMTKSLVSLILNKYKAQFELKTKIIIHSGELFSNAPISNLALTKLKYKYAGQIKSDI